MIALPITVTIAGAEYPINTDFRAGLRFEELLIEEEPPWDKILQLYYPAGVPHNLEKALDNILWFYRCGEDERKGGAGSNVRACDLNYDFRYIYAAFLEQYRIDLYEDDLHWWKFKALFNGLSDDCEICKIMQYRTADLKGMDKNEKAFYRKMKKQYALPALKSEKQKEREDKISQILLNGGDLSGAAKRGEVEL